jgi:DNA-directed RNA polymerase subunit RPC12/RpoP
MMSGVCIRDDSSDETTEMVEEAVALGAEEAVQVEDGEVEEGGAEEGGEDNQGDKVGRCGHCGSMLLVIIKSKEMRTSQKA